MAFPNEYVVQVQCKGKDVKCVPSGRDTVRGTTCYLDLSAVSPLPLSRFLPDAGRAGERERRAQRTTALARATCPRRSLRRTKFNVRTILYRMGLGALLFGRSDALPSF